MDNANVTAEPQTEQKLQKQEPPTQAVTADQKKLKIYVCSPYRLTTLTPEKMEQERRENDERVQLACWLIVQLNAIPYAPHGYFTLFLDDSIPAEREMGMKLGLDWLSECDELWVFGERISDGMAREIAYAKAHGIPVLCKPEPKELIERLLEELVKRYGIGTTEGAETEDNDGNEN